VGETTYYKRGQAPVDEFELAIEAIQSAAKDGGLPLRSLDGFASYSNDTSNTVRLANALGFDELRYSNMFWGGGGGGVCGAIGNAAAAIAGGFAEAVVVLRSLKQGDVRFGAGVGGTAPTISGPLGYVVPHGVATPAQTIALRTMRFMYELGLTQDALASVALASYEHAQHNPRAVMYGRPLTRGDYDESRWIVEPFHLFDCCQENDGAAAVILTSAEVAQDLNRPPVYVMAAAQGSTRGHDLFDHSGEPYAAANFSGVAKRLFAMGGIKPSEVDVAQIYENFTGAAVMSIIEHGLCEPAQAREFFRVENLLWNSGGLPVNTSGGNLAECYMHGLELVVEAARQLRGTSTCQVEGAEVCLVAGGPVTAPVSSLLLRR
jgi:acetyl-CoA acetyltransferase